MGVLKQPKYMGELADLAGGTLVIPDGWTCIDILVDSSSAATGTVNVKFTATTTLNHTLLPGNARRYYADNVGCYGVTLTVGAGAIGSYIVWN